MNAPDTRERSGILDCYIRDAERYPILSRDDETVLAERYAATKDPAAAHGLITGNLRLVMQVARTMIPGGCDLLDLIQEGNMGLLKAMEKYEPQEGVRFSTYAEWFVRGAMLDWIGRRSRIAQTEQELGQDDDFSSPSGHALPSWSTDADDHPDETAARSEVVGRVRPVLDRFVATLSPMDRDIFKSRWLSEDQEHIQSIGRRHGRPRKGIQRAEARMMRRLKESLEKTLGESAVAC